METKLWIKSHVQNRNFATSDKISISQFLSCSYHRHYSSKRLLKLATVAIRFGRRWVLEREDDGEGSIIMASWYQDQQQHNWASECPENLTSFGAWKLRLSCHRDAYTACLLFSLIGCMCRFCCQFRVGSVACVNMGRLPHHRLEIWPWPWQRCRKLKKRKSHSKLAKISLNSIRMYSEMEWTSIKCSETKICQWKFCGKKPLTQFHQNLIWIFFSNLHYMPQKSP